jgi:hypothetical protein
MDEDNLSGLVKELREIKKVLEKEVNRRANNEFLEVLHGFVQLLILFWLWHNTEGWIFASVFLLMK